MAPGGAGPDLAPHPAVNLLNAVTPATATLHGDGLNLYASEM